jgi:hypothetical protein
VEHCVFLAIILLKWHILPVLIFIFFLCIFTRLLICQPTFLGCSKDVFCLDYHLKGLAFLDHRAVVTLHMSVLKLFTDLQTFEWPYAHDQT